MAVSKRVRFEVLRRDNHTCRYCGANTDDGPLTVDHVVPVSLGGSDDPSNLVAACRDCNAGKASTSPGEALVANVAQDALRWRDALRQAARMQAHDREWRDHYTSWFREEWTGYGYGPDDLDYPIPDDWEPTIRQFYEIGLDIEELFDARDIAFGARGVTPENVWRYFCGVAWRKVNDMQEAARSLLAADEVDGGAA